VRTKVFRYSGGYSGFTCVRKCSAVNCYFFWRLHCYYSEL